MDAALENAVVALRGVPDRPTSSWRPSDADFASHRDHGEYAASKLFLETLGAGLAGRAVLDAGSGRMQTAKLVIAASGGVGRYTGLDREVDAALHAGGARDLVAGDFTSLLMDYEDVTADELPADAFDVLIVDVEPHGREIQVYDKLRTFMKPVHLVILKHVGDVAFMGSSLADRFLGRFLADRLVRDYFAERGLDFRDVFVIMTREPGDAVCRCAGMAQGRVTEWVDPKIPRIVRDRGHG